MTILDRFRLDGRVAVLTGASSGLGVGFAAALAGAELAVSGGWIGLRSHPRVVGSIVYGGPDVPSWLDVALRDIVPAAGASPDMEA